MLLLHAFFQRSLASNLFLNLNFLLCFFSFRGIVDTSLLLERKSNVYLYHFAISGEFLLKNFKSYASKTYSLKRSNLNQYVSKSQLKFSSQKLGQQMIPL